MDGVIRFFDILSSLGASVMMPVIITVFALLLGTGFGKAIRAGLMVGVGFVGLNTIIVLLGANLGPAAQQMVQNVGLELNTIDVGWPSAAAIAFGTKVGSLIIPLGIMINLLMLFARATETMIVDIWNYWHFAFTGSLVAILTGSTGWGLFAAAMNMIIVLVIADVTAPLFEEYNGLSGVSLPHGFSGAYAPIAWAVNKVMDHIPIIQSIDVDAGKLEKKLGVFGEPILMGTLIGLGIGALAYGIGDYGRILPLAITMGAVLVLIPKMAQILMEGLTPVSEAAKVFLQKRFSTGRKIYIGLDSAVALGHPVTLAVGLILTPVTILLALVVPGNQFIPFADLSSIPFMLIFVVPICRGNAFRTFVVGLVILSAGLLIATGLAPLYTQAAMETSFQMPEGVKYISSICDGANPLTWTFVTAVNLAGSTGGAAVLGAMSLGLAGWNRYRIGRKE
ncbi:MAG: PTS galactitol transporter subunit IIC [Eubacteriaceae bacterium]|nr:PTS galactitol transporter subunit IIC [Eubacteriaceae bacterium]